MENTMVMTGWKVYSRQGTKYRIRATYGLQKIGDQDPYVSVTADIQRQAGNNHWYDHAGGCCHEEIEAHFPELRPLIKWHLSSLKGPMHYTSNAVYWFEKMAGRSKWAPGIGEPDPLSAFRSTVVLGAVPGDIAPSLDASNEAVRTWCAARLPALIEQMKIDLAALGLLPPNSL
jgi:hypothetical protein